jgi:hypothetical protein
MYDDRGYLMLLEWHMWDDAGTGEVIIGVRVGLYVARMSCQKRPLHYQIEIRSTVVEYYTTCLLHV